MNKTILLIIVISSLLLSFFIVIKRIQEGNRRRKKREEHIRETGSDSFDGPTAPGSSGHISESGAGGFGFGGMESSHTDSIFSDFGPSSPSDSFGDPAHMVMPDSGFGDSDPFDFGFFDPEPTFGKDPKPNPGKTSSHRYESTVCPEETGPVMDVVRFSAVTDYNAEMGRYQEIDIFMYTDAYRSMVDQFIKDRSLKEKTSGYYRTSIGSRIMVILECPELSFTDKLDSFWAGRYLDFNFAVRIPEDCCRKELRFRACIYIEDVYSCALNLIVPVMKARTSLEVERKDIRSAFISYSSLDRNQVAAIVFGMKKVRPDMDIFFDVEKLHSGDRWEKILMQEIQRRDILYLCWSRNAKASEYVEKEWKYAYEKKGLEGIEPIPLEKPSVCPPPKELNELHFGDLMVYFIEDRKGEEAELQCISEGTTLHLKKGLVSVGTGPFNDLIVKDKDMEDRHFCISWNGNRGFLLQNLGQTDPTVVITDSKKRVLKGPVSVTITVPCIIKACSSVFLLN